jgi:hypothetical protein
LASCASSFVAAAAAAAAAFSCRRHVDLASRSWFSRETFSAARDYAVQGRSKRGGGEREHVCVGVSSVGLSGCEELHIVLASVHPQQQGTAHMGDAPFRGWGHFGGVGVGGWGGVGARASIAARR